jgi:UDP-N-acetylmuramoyl-L-alanyl-D-glutamate--2,6-diaminopimelate ligase
MTIDEIIRGIDLISFSGDRDRIICGIEFDSRMVKKGSLFIAVKGSKTDGHDYIQQAVSNGATAVICEILPSVED